MLIVGIIKNTLMITSFVLIMMLIIEYINVQSQGNWSRHLKKSIGMQLLVSALLGIIPGCLGAYTVVTLFTHNLVKFAALVTVMISTSGDEAFLMFSVIPHEALWLNGIIFIIAIAAGLIVHWVMKRFGLEPHFNKSFQIHKQEYCQCYETGRIIPQLYKISFERALLMSGLALFIFFLITGDVGHHHIDIGATEAPTEHQHEHLHEAAPEAGHGSEENHWNWVQITFLVGTAFALFVVTTVPQHFIKEHLWEHIVKKHLPKIFLWTLAALLVIKLLMHYVDLHQWLSHNQLIILIIAVVIGLIPESGPHMLFVTLFATGGIPFTTLLASSIVQDGHAALPLFAESKRSFIWVKIINLVIGFIVGITGLYLLA